MSLSEAHRKSKQLIKEKYANETYNEGIEILIQWTPLKAYFNINKLTTCVFEYAGNLVANVEDMQGLATFLQWDALSQ